MARLAALIPICFGMMVTSALTQSNRVSLHPEIGDKPPKELTASDILALPVREQKAWFHAAVSMTAQTVSMFDQAKASCVIDWYFDGDGAEALNTLFEKHSDQPATSIVTAVSGSVCKIDYPAGDGNK